MEVGEHHLYYLSWREPDDRPVPFLADVESVSRVDGGSVGFEYFLQKEAKMRNARKIMLSETAERLSYVLFYETQTMVGTFIPSRQYCVLQKGRGIVHRFTLSLDEEDAAHVGFEGLVRRIMDSFTVNPKFDPAAHEKKWRAEEEKKERASKN